MTNLKTFGTQLRALRLGWHWWDKRQCYVRLSPLKEAIAVEVATTFEALNEKPPTRLHSAIEDDALLELCEPLQGKFTRGYHAWEVGDDGKVLE